MSTEWSAPQSEAQLTGKVVYRCWACGADVDEDDLVFADEVGPLDVGQRLTPTTRTYHSKHVPEERR